MTSLLTASELLTSPLVSSLRRSRDPLPEEVIPLDSITTSQDLRSSVDNVKVKSSSPSGHTSACSSRKSSPPSSPPPSPRATSPAHRPARRHAPRVRFNVGGRVFEVSDDSVRRAENKNFKVSMLIQSQIFNNPWAGIYETAQKTNKIVR